MLEEDTDPTPFRPAKGAARLRALMAAPEIIVAPGVYDGYSARLVQAAGFPMAVTSGAGVANSLLGVEDLGFMGLHENIEHCRNMARSLSIPLTCDADDGYGNPMNVYRTVGLFEDAGAAGVNIEDQLSPKRCGHMPGKEVIALEDMVKKIEAACMARRDDEFVIIARTDALAVEGMEAMLTRVRAYTAAGADMIFPDAVNSDEHIKLVIEASGDVPVSINMGFGIRSRLTTPLIPFKKLEAMGVKRASLPRLLPASAIKGMTASLEVLKEAMGSDEIVDRPDLMVSIEDIWELMDAPKLRALEKDLLSTEAHTRKYGRGGTDR